MEEKKQPFKQVFRELCIKLPEELDRTHSLMFAGNQIQPAKTAACLKTRRWVADYEEGLQKIYYKENIIAHIFMLQADWYPPSDIEAPTLNGGIHPQENRESIKVKDIPAIVYSEVMRDVDLGGERSPCGRSGSGDQSFHRGNERPLWNTTCLFFGIDNVVL